MTSPYKSRLFIILTCLPLLLAAAGCTEEKALALQSAAVQYRDQAVKALNMTANGIRASTAMPKTTSATLSGKLKGFNGKFEEKHIELLLTGDSMLANAADSATEPLEKLRDRIIEFSAVFDNLPRGSYLAKEEVSRTLPIALRLNQSMLNLAGQIDNGKIRIVDNARRIELIEETNAALDLPVGEKRDQALLRVSNDLVELTVREQKMRRDASVNLLQAAEIGNSLIGLARNYDQVSLGDVLNSMNDSLRLAGRISPDSDSITNALKRLNSAAKAWEEDPTLKPLLDQNL